MIENEIPTWIEDASSNICAIILEDVMLKKRVRDILGNEIEIEESKEYRLKERYSDPCK